MSALMRAMSILFCMVSAAACGPGGAGGEDADAHEGEDTDGQDGADPAADPGVDDALEPADPQDPDMTADRRFRLPVTVDAAGLERTDRPVELHVSFTQALESLGRTGELDDRSILVVETDGAGGIVDDEVPFQFDRDADYDAAANAAGTLVFIAEGILASAASRTYDVRFDLAGGPFTTPMFDPLVTLADGEADAGQACYRIEAAGGTLYYQKDAGAFSSFVDAGGNDWIGFDPAPGSGSAGEYRGIPNAIYPEGQFHPGSTDAASEVVSSGPLKITVRSATTDGLWECTWAFYPSWATMTMLRAGHPHWLLYEGTPGGSLDPASDTLTRSDGTQNPLSESWDGDLSGEEWVFFGDPGAGRSLFLAHHEEDALNDTYWPMEGNMTVFGFGRSDSPLEGLIADAPQRLTIGLVESTEAGACASFIRAAIGPLTVTQGAAEEI